MSALQQLLAAIGGPGITVAYYTSGTTSFEVPAGVTAISMLTVGGGGGGNDCQSGGGSGGGGGGLSFSNNVSVTAGETLTCIIGAGGVRGTWPGGGTQGTGGTGGTTSIKRGATVLVEATGGQGGWSPSTAATGGNVVGGVGDTQFNGGSGGLPAGSEIRGGGGGQCGDLYAAVAGANGATATLDYRGGGSGGGFALATPELDNYAISANSILSVNRNGGAGIYFGAGSGGGAYGDAGFTLAGIGAAGNGGIALLIWNSRTFVPGDGDF